VEKRCDESQHAVVESAAEMSASDDEVIPTMRLTELVDRHQRSLFNYLAVLLGDADAALDCAQETFLRGYGNLQRGKPVNASWLYRVGRNVAMDVLRSQANFPVEHLDDEASAVLESSVPDEDGEVRRALAQLSPSDRELLYLAYVDRFRARGIAELLGTREGAVRTRLLRANRRFVAVYEREQ
jgi:RNA polymerase sigma-70 factor, ECF subfamily